MSNRYETKLDKLEKIKRQIKEEEKRIEQEIGKHVLKTFDLTYSDIDEVKSLVEELYLIYKENKNDDDQGENESEELEKTMNSFGG